MKQSAKVMVCGGMRGRGLTRLHILPSGQTLTSEYYIKEILEKEVKPLTSRRQVTGGPTERMFFRSKKAMTFVHYGAPPQTSKAAQTRCLNNLPNFVPKDDWPASSPDLNHEENISNITDEITYKERSSPENTGQAKKVTSLRLEKCDSRRA